MPPDCGPRHKAKSAKYTLKSRNQILIKHTWHFSIILISLRVEVAQISDFLRHAKILPLCKACYDLNLPHSTLGKKDIALIFLYLSN